MHLKYEGCNILNKDVTSTTFKRRRRTTATLLETCVQRWSRIVPYRYAVRWLECYILDDRLCESILSNVSALQLIAWYLPRSNQSDGLGLRVHDGVCERIWKTMLERDVYRWDPLLRCRTVNSCKSSREAYWRAFAGILTNSDAPMQCFLRVLSTSNSEINIETQRQLWLGCFHPGWNRTMKILSDSDVLSFDAVLHCVEDEISAYCVANDKTLQAVTVLRSLCNLRLTSVPRIECLKLSIVQLRNLRTVELSWSRCPLPYSWICPFPGMTLILNEFNLPADQLSLNWLISIVESGLHELVFREPIDPCGQLPVLLSRIAGAKRSISTLELFRIDDLDRLDLDTFMYRLSELRLEEMDSVFNVTSFEQASQLKSLQVVDCRLSTDFRVALYSAVSRSIPHLVNLRLSEIRTSLNASTLFSALATNRSIECLNVSYNSLRADFVAQLIACLGANNTLRVLDISYTSLGTSLSATQAEEMGAAIAMSSLTTLNISANRLDDVNVINILSPSFVNEISLLKSVQCARNLLTDNALMMLTYSLLLCTSHMNYNHRDSFLKELDLAENYFSETAMKSVRAHRLPVERLVVSRARAFIYDGVQATSWADRIQDKELAAT